MRNLVLLGDSAELLIPRAAQTCEPFTALWPVAGGVAGVAPVLEPLAPAVYNVNLKACRNPITYGTAGPVIAGAASAGFSCAAGAGAESGLTALAADALHSRNTPAFTYSAASEGRM